MANIGRPEKPARLKVVKGNFKPKAKGKSASGAGKKSLVNAAPDRPPHLDDDEIVIWDKLVEHLQKIGTLQKCDQGTLEAYCTTYASLIRDKKALAAHRDKYGGSDYYSTESRHGEVIRAHPALAGIERKSRVLKMLASEFGMTPASRKNMGYDPTQLALPFDEKPDDDPSAGLV